MPAWEILKTIWGHLSITTYYVELCQGNVEKRPQRQWSLRKKCQSIGSCAIQSYTVSAVFNSLRTLEKRFLLCFCKSTHWRLCMKSFRDIQSQMSKLATCMSKIRCQIFQYMCYKLNHMENRSPLWQELSENRLCLYSSSSDDMLFTGLAFCSHRLFGKNMKRGQAAGQTATFPPLSLLWRGYWPKDHYWSLLSLLKNHWFVFRS